MKEFILSCESTVDLSYDYVIKRGASVLFYTYLLNNKEQNYRRLAKWH